MVRRYKGKENSKNKKKKGRGVKEYPEERNRRRHELEVELGSRLQSGPTMSLRLNDDYWRKKMI